MEQAILEIPDSVHSALRSHLMQGGSEVEEAAFVFAATARRAGDLVFRFEEWMPVEPMGFSVRSPFCLELSDETRGAVIKRAHDLGVSIIEFHSHPHGPARFSWSDKAGLLAFVPHVRWRLSGKPYCAVVLSPDAYDAVAWDDSGERIRVSKIVTDTTMLTPTGWTFENWDSIDEYTTV